MNINNIEKVIRLGPCNPIHLDIAPFDGEHSNNGLISMTHQFNDDKKVIMELRRKERTIAFMVRREWVELDDWWKDSELLWSTEWMRRL